MKRILSILGNLLLWALVIGFALFFNGRAKQHRAQTTISAMEVILTDSLQDEVLVKKSIVEEWVRNSGIEFQGVPVENVDLNGIEQAISRNGFIQRVNTRTTFDGRLMVEVSQRRPLLRMMVDGYNCYLTGDGFIFPSPRLSAVYAPIVTGSYTPPVPAQYVGKTEDYISSLIAESEQRIADMQHEKVPLFEQDKKIRQQIKEVRKIRISKRFWKELRLRFNPSYQDEYDQDVRDTRAYKAELRRKYRYQLQMNDNKIDRISQRQDNERQSQKKLLKRYEDLVKLINFVKYIEDNAFWQAEIVEIVASEMSNGELQLELIPRSGNHRILFGTADNVEDKLDKLMSFYQSGLTNIGWDEFRTISLKYDGQVVCRK